ncbi:hypothetical protein RP726_13910 [Candidatus Methylospira mobilis]|uniref:hypothetical protein n=1 Tax=Candidatus Methylospira mobilis TaxID=1808979 RepID=UPI0028EA8CDC|nr:hypothetical protein [Candidatus Methylospira mobilis]WNV03539.1 hypothetical protein RP726_13910 [Candidatus Methylospira mobilis]
MSSLSHKKSLGPVFLNLLARAGVACLLAGTAVAFAQEPAPGSATAGAGQSLESEAKTGVAANMVGAAPAKLENGGLYDEGSYTDILDWIKQTKFHGNLRAYFFAREDTGSKSPLGENSFSLGGFAGFLTAPVYGLQAAFTLGAANSIGVNPKPAMPQQLANYSNYHGDMSLPSGSFWVAKEAYMKYTNRYFMVRGPDQVLDTPWIMPSDSRMTPSSWRAVYGELYPFKDHDNAELKKLSLVGLRIFDFQGRSDTTYLANNLYMPGHMQGQAGLAALNNQSTPGALAFGAKYGTSKDALSAQVWWHQFYNFSQLLWLDGSYLWKTGTGFDPLIGAQFANQEPDGSNMLALAKSSGGAAAATQAYGVIAGVDTQWIRFTAAWNDIVAKQGTFQNGNLVSPYSWGYATDPLYTTMMINGIIEKNTSGQAWKIAGTSFFMDKQIKVILSYASFYLAGNANGAAGNGWASTSYVNGSSNETDADVTYFFPKDSALDGLSIRNRIGVAQGNQSRGHDWYERFQIQYQF